MANHQKHDTIPAVCSCGNNATDTMCDECAYVATQPQHVGHFSHLGGTWYCDTCESPYCELA